jgi:hypothetical protein
VTVTVTVMLLISALQNSPKFLLRTHHQRLSSSF